MGHHGPAAFWQECTREFRQSGAGQCDIVVYPLPSLAEAKIKSLAEELSVYLSWASQLGEKEEFFLGGLPARAFGLNPESPWVQSICLFLDKFDIVVLFSKRAVPYPDSFKAVLERIKDEVLIERRYRPRDLAGIVEWARVFRQFWAPPDWWWINVLVKRIVFLELPAYCWAHGPGDVGNTCVPVPWEYEKMAREPKEASPGNEGSSQADTATSALSLSQGLGDWLPIGLSAPPVIGIWLNNLGYTSSRLAEAFAKEFTSHRRRSSKRKDPVEKFCYYLLQEGYSADSSEIREILESAAPIDKKLERLTSLAPTVRRFSASALADLFQCTPRAIQKTATYKKWRAEAKAEGESRRHSD